MMFQPNASAAAANSGGINYITNWDAETDASGWATYADAAATSPVDGTGGAPTVVDISRSDASPLRSVASFQISHSAANGLGEGISYDFTIDAADKAKVLQISFDYNIYGGTYADDDLGVWIYDVTNATLIQPSPYLIKNHATSGEKWFGEFQTSSSSTSYRLIIHSRTNTATMYIMQIDNIIVGPQAKLYGSPITDWVAYTPTGSWVSNTNYDGRWRRVGDSMEVQVNIYTTGAPTAATLTLNLPSGYSVDTDKLSAASGGSIGDDRTSLGTMVIRDAGSTSYVGGVYYNSTTSVVPYVFDASAANTRQTAINATSPMTWANTDQAGFMFRVPITGWGSSAIMSSDAATRPVAVNYNGTPTGTIDGSTDNKYPTKVTDTHGAYNTSTGLFTAPVPGFYDFSVAGFISFTTGSFVAGSLIKNSVTTIMGIQYPYPSAFTNQITALLEIKSVELKAGDTVAVRFNANGSPTFNATAGYNWFSVNQVQGPSQIMASELVEAHYSTAAGQSIETGAGETIDFGTKVIDSHGSVTTGASWKFTAPKTGTYSVKAATQLASGGGWAAGEYHYIALYKNGSEVELLGVSFQQATHTTNTWASGSTDIKLIAGEYIHIHISQNSGGTIALQANANNNYVSIVSR